MVTFMRGPEGNMPIFEISTGRVIDVVSTDFQADEKTSIGQVATRTVYIADDSGEFPEVPVVSPLDPMHLNWPA